jgi:TRAP-type C4-dicarboxylate transport system permease small subunit
MGMMVLTCADITFRFFRHPIVGTWEIVGLLGAVAAGFALVPTTLGRAHVAVQVLVDRYPYWAQKWIYLITHTLSLLLFTLLTLETIKYGNALKEAGEVSNTLQLPYFPILYGIAFSALVVVLVIFSDLLMVIAGKEKAWYGWPE